MGYLFSSYIWTYLLCLIPMGMLTDRFGPRWVNAIGLSVWSIATALTGLVSGYSAILASRLVMGAAEASSYPAGGRVIREWAPSRERGLASTMLNSGGYAGPAIGTLFLSWIVSEFSWRAGFVAAGAICVVWLIPWVIWYRNPSEAPFLDEEERKYILEERDSGRSPAEGGGVGLAGLLSSRTMWAIAIAQGCAVYSQILFLTWLPSYLEFSKGLSIVKSGLFTALPYAFAVIFSWLAAHISDRVMNASEVGQGGRRRAVVVAMLSSSVVLVTPFIDNIWLILGLITISLTGLATGLSLNIALTNDLLVSYQDSGKAMAVQVSGGNAFGLVAPIVTGYVITYTGSYDWAFGIAGLLLIVGAIIVMTLTRTPIGAKVPSGAGQVAALST
jgi:ACS family glucarate transporter-like MFS transporter